MFNKKLEKRVKALEVLAENLNQRELADYRSIKEIKEQIKSLDANELQPYEKKYIFQFIGELQDYLKIRLEEVREVDPNYLKPEPRTKMVWRIRKLKK